MSRDGFFSDNISDGLSSGFVFAVILHARGREAMIDWPSTTRVPHAGTTGVASFVAGTRLRSEGGLPVSWTCGVGLFLQARGSDGLNVDCSMSARAAVPWTSPDSASSTTIGFAPSAVARLIPLATAVKGTVPWAAESVSFASDSVSSAMMAASGSRSSVSRLFRGRLRAGLSARAPKSSGRRCSGTCCRMREDNLWAVLPTYRLTQLRHWNS